MRQNGNDFSQHKIANLWLAEMLQILGPSQKVTTEIKHRIIEHIHKCNLSVANLRTKSMFFLFDNSELNYLFVSKSTSSVLGYSNEEISKKGFQWLFTLFSETELEYKKKVMADVFQFLKTLDREMILSCTVSYNLVAQRKDGKKVHLLEEMMFPEVNTNGEPLITSCFLHNLSDFGTSEVRKCRIYLENNGFEEIIFSESYNVCERTRETDLSQREVQVLEQFSKGLNTKQVAQKLFVTENTIKTHRKNILLKLQANNTAQAIKIAMKKKLFL